MLRTWTARIRALLRSGDLDRELDHELGAHLELLEQDHLRRGLPPEQARRAARVELGGMTSLREQHRGIRGLPALEAVWQDLRFAFRMLAKERWFSAAAISALALGIGVNAIGFTIVNTAFIKGVGLKDQERLVAPCFQVRTGVRCSFSFPELQDLRAATGSLAEVAAWDTSVANLSDDRTFPEQVNSVWVSANLFGMLGYAPMLGRDFRAADERRAGEPVVILGYEVWKNRFGSDTSVLGKTLKLSGQTATIIGVMPDGLRFPSNHQLWALWAPFHREDEYRRERRGFDVVGRLRDGATSRQAQGELTGIALQIAAAYPGSEPGSDLIGVRVRTFADQFGVRSGRVANMFVVLMGAGCLVLLIACANVANLLLSRAGYRRREMAVRLSLGATRWRLVRQLVLESLVLGFIGGGLGLLLASAGVSLFEAALQNTPGKPYWLIFAVDYSVVAYVGAICIGTAVLFGLAPALQLSKTASSIALKENTRGSHGSRRTTVWSGALVVTELTLAVVLLVGAGLMARSFVKMYSLNLGFAPDHLVMFGLDLLGNDYESPDARRAFADQLESRVAAIPGVESAAFTTGVPPRHRTEAPLEIEGAEPRMVSVVAITPRFFETLGMSLLRGRGFTPRDGAAGAETVLINERLAAQLFPGADPVGKRLRFARRRPAPGQAPEAWRTVIGITPTIRQGSLQDGYLNAVVYTPYRQDPDGGAYLLVRSKLSPGAVSDAVRTTMRGIDPGQPLRPVQTLEQWMASERWPFRVFGGLLAGLAIVALVLSSVGLYAVMAYAVAHRTQEIGVRVAVGAQPRQVAWLVMKRGLWQVGIGLTLGTAGALALSRVLKGILVEIQPSDPATFAGIATLLTVVSIAACLVPARRATRVDPVVALRAE